MTSPQNPWQQFPPQQPFPGPPPQYAVARPTPPGSVVFARWLAAVCPPLIALLGVIGYAISTVQILDAGFGPTLWILVNGVLTLGAAVCGVLWLVLSGGLRKGRRSARIVLVVLAIAWLLHTLYSATTFVLSFAHDFGSITLNPILLLGIGDLLLSLVVPIVFLILVATPSANAYFRAMAGR
ncbi:hypothetical protein ABT337_19945 [Saccharopolyspora hirsuta]|uniref:Uncharacterized protein n=1 Tax=Saccharopolyspora hirsuta TaxID=1837 RepID=A0A5M7C4M8_SACHI|nr:hypothetical protein [Saccharopolyspora hirsuta]KAA5833325.1 hypothetical protein F1721_13525 [Saccharopolyspora hirsuta]MBF6508014.1 hypothetical protein [Nocardia farcinica]